MTEVISVRFRGGCKNYDFDPRGNQVKMGEEVVVETSQGPEFATCTMGNHEIEDDAVVQPLCPMLRRATENDRATVEYNRKRESEAFDICEQKIAEHGLEMKLVNVNCSFDGSKIIFFFTADGRVDFRELVRDLASVFRARIELRQIGVRDEAKMIGGLGICGRPFCCSQFLDSFMPVSIKMAKTQNLSLNPTKISGTCGRLMCCLKYEQNAYEDAAKRMPKNESFVQTPDGPGNVKSVDLLQEKVRVSLDGSAPTEPLKTYHNCEICVLRNGKGSRDGIEIPAERPERFAQEKKEEGLSGFAVPFYMSQPEVVRELEADAPVREKFGSGEGDGKRRRRHRGHRDGKGESAVKVETAKTENKTGRTAEKAAAVHTPEERSGEGKKSSHRRHRGHRGGAKSEGAVKVESVKAEAPKKPEIKSAAPKSGEGEQSAKRHRPHHRGGRRHHGGGEAPKSEA